MPSQDVLSLIGDEPHWRWNIETPVGTPVVVTYSFPDAPMDYAPDNTVGSFAGFTPAHQEHVRTALRTWSDAAGITFVEVPAGQGDILFTMFDMDGLTNSSGNPLSGYAYYPSYRWTSDGSGDRTYYQARDDLSGDVFLNADYYAADAGTIAPGQRGYSILIHEIGHALGFEHPFSGDYVIDDAHDNGSYTVMSYDRSRSTTQLGSVDIEALQYLYGLPGEALESRYIEDEGAIEITGPNAGSWLQSAWGGPNILIGGRGGDTILGGTGSDTLDGGAGGDSLNGSDGDDLLIEGAGNDTHYGGYGFDTLQIEASARGTEVQIAAGFTEGWIEHANGERDVLVSVEAVQVLGAIGVSVSGMVYSDTITGGDGDDTIDGRGGDDLIDGGAGDDSLAGGYDGQGTLIGGAGDDVIEGGIGGDWIDGGAGADAIDGGDGQDTVSYESATRSVRVDLQNDRLMYGDAVGDTFVDVEVFQTGGTIDQLRGDAGANEFHTGGLSDRLYGRAGDDLLFGEDGADALYGGLGADVMTGGAQAGRTDRYIYFNMSESGVGAGNRDVITDFVAGEDRIEIGRLDADTTQGRKQGFDFVGDAGLSGTAGELGYVHQGGNTIVQTDVDGDGAADFEIELTGVMDLTESDFLI